MSNFPAWYYGPGGESGIFKAPDEVPVGWKDSPEKVVEPEAPKPENSKDAWGGYYKDDLIQILRKDDRVNSIDARFSARKLYEQAKGLDLVE